MGVLCVEFRLFDKEKEGIDWVRFGDFLCVKD